MRDSLEFQTIEWRSLDSMYIHVLCRALYVLATILTLTASPLDTNNNDEGLVTRDYLPDFRQIVESKEEGAEFKAIFLFTFVQIQPDAQDRSDLQTLHRNLLDLVRSFPADTAVATSYEAEERRVKMIMVSRSRPDVGPPMTTIDTQ